MPVFRPLAGDDKQEIIALARRIGTYEISAEPFHDCCPVFLPKVPALHASSEDLDNAEAAIASASDGTCSVEALVARGLAAATLERFRYTAGHVEQLASAKAATS